MFRWLVLIIFEEVIRLFAKRYFVKPIAKYIEHHDQQVDLKDDIRNVAKTIIRLYYKMRIKS